MLTTDPKKVYQLTDFVCRGKITAGFIITGPNIASQHLLFDQLAERLCASTRARFVRLRASEVPNLKAALKKIIRGATARGDDGEEGADLEVSQGVSPSLGRQAESS
jgi:origin recognition complex subunit 3